MNRKCCDTPRGSGPHAARCANNPENQGARTVCTAGGVRQVSAAESPDVEPDWSRGCKICNARPVVPMTGMCGPHTFGEAATAGGE
jgi:hypothetical protein